MTTSIEHCGDSSSLNKADCVSLIRSAYVLSRASRGLNTTTIHAAIPTVAFANIKSAYVGITTTSPIIPKRNRFSPN